jgi:hypothetical protein
MNDFELLILGILRDGKPTSIEQLVGITHSKRSKVMEAVSGLRKEGHPIYTVGGGGANKWNYQLGELEFAEFGDDNES